MSIRAERTVVLVKQETTYATDAVPTAADNAVLVYDLNIAVDGQVLVRNGYRVTQGPLEHIIGRKLVDVGFKSEVKGAGAAYSATVLPEIAPLLTGCGLSETIDTTVGAETVIYQPQSSNQKSNTIYVYLDGLLHKVTGSFGNPSLTLEGGQYPSIQWTFKGLFQSVVDAALPTPILSSVKPPLVESAGLTIGAWADGEYQNFNLTMDNNIVERPDLNSVEGLAALEIMGRNTSGGMNPLAVTEATKSFWANWEAGLAEALSLTIGADQYNRFSLTAPAVQIQSIGYGDRNGARTYEKQLRFAESTGDDEFVLTFD